MKRTILYNVFEKVGGDAPARAMELRISCLRFRVQ